MAALSTIFGSLALGAGLFAAGKAATQKAPKVPEPPKPPPPPKAPSEEELFKRNQQAQTALAHRAIGAKGRSDTILTSSRGASAPQTDHKTLLGY